MKGGEKSPFFCSLRVGEWWGEKGGRRPHLTEKKKKGRGSACVFPISPRRGEERGPPTNLKRVHGKEERKANSRGKDVKGSVSSYLCRSRKKKGKKRKRPLVVAMSARRREKKRGKGRGIPKRTRREKKGTGERRISFFSSSVRRRRKTCRKAALKGEGR